jgi:hypothetical protein
MTPALQEYLAIRSFVETTGSNASHTGITAREYENSEFRIRIVNERSSETYVQVGLITKPAEHLLLNGIIAFLTNDDSATRITGQHGERLTEHHAAIARFFAASPEGEAERERYLSWQSEFAAREQLRLAAEAGTAIAARKPWWSLW